MGEVSGSGSCQGQEEIKRPNQGLIAFAGRYEMTAAAKCHQTLLWGVPEGRRSPKGRSVGTGRMLLALEVAADAIQEAREYLRGWRPEAAAGSVEHGKIA
jgi:hypothetical protein